MNEVLKESVRLTGAGRTDAGCHARGQVASFTSETRLPARSLPPLLARRLPEDVQVRVARDVEHGFDARRSARARRYAYRLLERGDVLLQRLAWHPRRALDAGRLEAAVRPLEGEHDCTALAAAGGTAHTTCRVLRAGWRRWEGGLQLDLVADHFLYHMVRNVVGTALAVMGRPDPAAAVAEIMASRSRARGGATAPPQGLCLEQVFYDEEAR
ncbi:MAG: tRNA pseudouridine(38-40) synthase TruA [Candidatus Eisenbacteria bacterium]|uniref:tRNA pseudouridine synthase n=1 Tax=Eiseniibacteriota bacterium TaxID=2212470 RepID=A0A538U6Q0_UNCEI|nr:MAG: tRNA pseudouridine(38-40) synthase TruA [Candidatus Eisenbacteria bacterium]